MKWIKRIIILMVIVLGVAVGVVVGFENEQRVAFQLMGFPPIEAPLGLLILMAVLLGTLLGFVVSLIAFMNSKQQMMSLKRSLKQRETELERLRQAPLQSS